MKMNKIFDLLLNIEEQYDVDILFASETGSRAWKTHSNKSDFDVKFVYIHNKRKRYYVQGRRNVIVNELDKEERTIVFKDEENDCDFHGWDITKALRHVEELNPSVIEWLASSIIYIDDGVFSQVASEYLDQHCVRNELIRHYRGYANGVFLNDVVYDVSPEYNEDYGHLNDIQKLASWSLDIEFDNILYLASTKRLLYVVRSIIMMNWIKIQNCDFQLNLKLNKVLWELFDRDEIEHDLYKEIRKLINYKKSKVDSFVPSEKMSIWIIETLIDSRNTIFKRTRNRRWYQRTALRIVKMH